MAQPTNLLTWSRSDTCRLEIDLAQRGAQPISRNLFGKFTEHLGRNIYNGQWAQVLKNPGFESWKYFAQSEDNLTGMYRHARPASAGLLQSDPARVAVWWMPFGQGDVGHALDGGARNSDLCQRLDARRLDSPEVGVQQPIFLPTHRIGEYRVTLWARTKGAAGRLCVSVAANDGQPLGGAKVPLPGGEWTKLETALSVDRTQAEPGEPLLFRLGVDAPTTVWLDQVFLFPADHVEGFDPDVVRLLKSSQLPLLRWPGGNFVSGYHWKDGIGPLDDRPYRHNRPWNMPEYNHVGTDEFMDFCRAVGCEPMICLNAGDGTPEEAADWVEYCNGSADTEWGAKRAANGHPEPYGIRYWEIGNELYGRWQIGHCTAEEYAKRYRAFYEAMHALDPTILFIANGNDPGWNKQVIAGAGDTLRSLSLHTLIGGGAREQTDAERIYLALMGYPVHYARHLRQLGKQMLVAGIEPKLAVTELQIFTNRRRLPNNASLSEALWVACLINVCARTGGAVEMITHSALVNHGGGLRKVNEIVFPTPVHWCHHLYSTQPCDRPLPVTLVCPSYDSPGAPGIPAPKNVPYLDCLALTDTDGERVTLFLVNRHPTEDLPVRIKLAGQSGRREATVSTLAAESYLTENDWRAPDRVKPVESRITVVDGETELRCPRHSLMRIVVPSRLTPQPNRRRRDRQA